MASQSAALADKRKREIERERERDIYIVELRLRDVSQLYCLQSCFSKREKINFSGTNMENSISELFFCGY